MSRAENLHPGCSHDDHRVFMALDTATFTCPDGLMVFDTAAEWAAWVDELTFTEKLQYQFVGVQGYNL